MSETAPGGVNGSASKGGQPAVLVPPQIGQRREAAVSARNAQRASTLQLLESGSLDDAKPAPAVEPKPAPAVAAPTAAEVELANETEDGIPDDEVEEKPAAEKAAPANPAVNAGLAQIQSAEKKWRATQAKEKAALEKERADFAREREESKAEREDAAKYRALKKAAPTDPATAFRELGVDLEYGAKQTWQHHLATKDPTNPQVRDAAARLQRDQANETELSVTKKRLADLEDKFERQNETAKIENDAAQYFHGMAKEIPTADAPLLARAIAKNPQGTWKRLANITMEIEKELGERPDAADVIATYEKRRLEELDELGIAPPSAAANDSATPKKNHTPADKKQPAKTLGTDLSTPRVVQPRTAKSDREHRAETLSLLESGKLE
jgi:hypothetical protein